MQHDATHRRWRQAQLQRQRQTSTRGRLRRALSIATTRRSINCIPAHAYTGNNQRSCAVGFGVNMDSRNNAAVPARAAAAIAAGVTRRTGPMILSE